MAKTEQEKAKAREYYLLNKEAILSKQKARRACRKETMTLEELAEFKAKEKEKNARNYAQNRERILGYKKKHRDNNRDEINARKRAWRKSAAKPYDHLKKYGITKDDYLRMVEEQGGVCAICGKPDSIRLAVDHCHTTGIVRGLLCSGCNTSLGKFNDDIEVLRKAIEYLEKANGNIANATIA